MRQTGGCRLNELRVTAPFATLEASPDRLTLTLSAESLPGISSRVLTFTPRDVAEVRAVRGVPVLATGVQLRHHQSDAPEAVLFWVLAARPGPLLNRIRAAGFVARGRRSGCSPVWEIPQVHKRLMVAWLVAMAGIVACVFSFVLWPLAVEVAEQLGQL